MNKERDRIDISIKLPREQVARLELLRKAIGEATGKPFTRNDLFEKIVADFLEK